MNRGAFDIAPVVAFVHESRCDGCGECIAHCPLGALELARTVAVNEAICRGCGSCIAACPRNALDLHCYTTAQMRASICAALAGKEKGDIRILVFCDDATTYRLADNVGTSKLAYSPDTRIIRVPSGSRITPELMLQAFEEGADGILIGESEEKSCPYSHSVSVIEKNVAKVKGILSACDMDPERVRFVEFVTVMLSAFVSQVNQLADYARKSQLIGDFKRKTIAGRLGNLIRLGAL
jgi:heterodisulfide reductase subunit A